MAATLVGSNTFVFADGGSGHVCNLGSSPSVGQYDVLAVNSDTTVSTPSGFTAAPTSVNNQGAYIFRRQAAGGEGSTVTVTTNGNFNCQVSWQRLGNVVAADDAAATQASVNGTSTPSHSTATLTESTEIVLAFAALHEFGASVPTSPSWSSGYTPLMTATQGSGGSGVVGFTAYKQPAGTAPESPSVSWTNNAADRYMLTLTFTTVAGSTVSGTATTVLGALFATATGKPTVHGTVATALGALAATATGKPTVHGIAATTLAGLTATAVGRPTVLAQGVTALGGLTATAVGLRTVNGAATTSLGRLVATAIGPHSDPVGPGQPVVSQTSSRTFVSSTREVYL